MRYVKRLYANLSVTLCYSFYNLTLARYQNSIDNPGKSTFRSVYLNVFLYIFSDDKFFLPSKQEILGSVRNIRVC